MIRIALAVIGIFLLQINFLHAQHYVSPVSELYSLEGKVRSGSKADLIKLCNFVTDTQRVIDRLGYHEIETTRGAIALRLLRENTFFLSNEIELGDSNIQTHISDRITAVADKVYFDKRIGAFFITPLQKRKTDYRVLKLPETEMEKLKLTKNKMLSEDWLKRLNIERLIHDHNPFAMAAVAEEMLWKRDRYNEYDFDEDRYTNLIALMTGTVLGVPDLNGEFTYHMERHFDDCYGTTKLNYAIYWACNYMNYSWNPATNLFENKKIQAEDYPDVYKWYLQLADTSGQVAIAAFKRLTETDCASIRKAINEFGNEKHNWALPTFYDRFLTQMCELTRYCRSENIDYEGNQDVQKKLATLGERNLPYSQRYTIENELINTLTFYDITAVEYWGLVYENHYGSTFSIGRIVDKFYSKNWKQICSDKKQLALYLKKATLYKRLGIIGSNNFYLTKFTNIGKSRLSTLKIIENETNDPDIKSAIKQVLTGSYWEQLKLRQKSDSIRVAGYRKMEKNIWPDNMRVSPIINNMEDTLQKVKNSRLPKDKKADIIRDIAYLATYSQLPTALKYLSKIENAQYYYPNRILQEQFGITIDYIRSGRDLNIFLENYNKLDENSLYRYYLVKAGLDIWDKNGGLEYEKIYNILKYDLTMAFVGGGGMERKTGIFAITKILESQFGINFGLPNKNEHRIGNTYCSFTNDRREKWLAYLKENKLAKGDNEPPSFFDSGK